MENVAEEGGVVIFTMVSAGKERGAEPKYMQLCLQMKPSTVGDPSAVPVADQSEPQIRWKEPFKTPYDLELLT